MADLWAMSAGMCTGMQSFVTLCCVMRIKKALGIFNARQLITTTTTTRVAF